MHLDQFKPCLTNGYRLQHEQKLGSYVLLYPEGLIELNDSAAMILQLCDGNHTVHEIIHILEKQFPESNLKNDIHDFLETAHEKKWIQYQ